MKPVAYILVVGSVVIGGLGTALMKFDHRATSSELYGIRFKEDAREAAVTGMNLTINRIMSDRDHWTNPELYEIATTVQDKATFQTTVRSLGQGDTVEVTAVGIRKFIDREGNAVDTVHTIDVRIIRADVAVDSADVYGSTIVEWAEW